MLLEMWQPLQPPPATSRQTPAQLSGNNQVTRPVFLPGCSLPDGGCCLHVASDMQLTTSIPLLTQAGQASRVVGAWPGGLAAWG